jgi:hypothetical protein
VDGLAPTTSHGCIMTMFQKDASKKDMFVTILMVLLVLWVVRFSSEACRGGNLGSLASTSGLVVLVHSS